MSDHVIKGKSDFFRLMPGAINKACHAGTSLAEPGEPLTIPETFAFGALAEYCTSFAVEGIDGAVFLELERKGYIQTRRMREGGA